MTEVLTINKDQLATLLGCSLPTVTALIKRYPDIPIVERGGLGQEWKFDGPAVVAFLQARRDEQNQARAAKDEQLSQLALPITERDGDADKVSADERLKLARLRQLEREELKEAGFLVPTHEVRAVLERAMRRYAQIQESAVERISNTHNLPEAVRRALVREFQDARAAFVAELSAGLKGEGDEPRSLFG